MQHRGNALAIMHDQWSSSQISNNIYSCCPLKHERVACMAAGAEEKIMAGLLAVMATAALGACDGETLPNGICLSDPWPPIEPHEHKPKEAP